MAYLRFLIVTVTATVVLLHCSSKISAQDFCGLIGDDTQFQVGETDMFYLDIDHPACCNGSITSWRVCYHGPEDDDDDSQTKPYRVKYAVYRPFANDTGYDLVPGSNRSTTLYRPSSGCGDSTSGRHHSKKKNNIITMHDQLSLGGFHCYEQPLDTDSHVVIEEGDVVGACIVDDPNGKMKQLNVISKVSGQSPDSAWLYGIDSEQHVNTCQEGTNIPNSIMLNQLSVINSTRLHLSANITTMATFIINTTSDISTENLTANMSTVDMSDPEQIKIVCRSPDNEMTDNSCNTPARKRQRRAYQTIMNKPRFNEVCKNLSVLNALKHLSHDRLAVRAVLDREVNLSAPIYLLSAAVKSLGKEQVDTSEITEILLNISSNLLDIPQIDRESWLESLEPPWGIAGSTLLKLIDRFALNNYNLSHTLSTTIFNNIVFRVEEVRAADIVKNSVSLIDEDSARISIPREVLECAAGGAPVRIASFLFRNVTGLLPESFSDEDQIETITDQEDRVLRLASPVISASCDNCITSDLSTPVEIIFTHSPYDEALLTNDESGTTTCVFWEFEDDTRQGSILFTGEWSTEGCETYFNSTSTVCRCNHLTHFAILLSARPLEFPSPQVLALQITGYIGVSVSLFAMAVTIFIFLFLKPLRTMRNYIHIQLCVTLGIAQIIFVAGVEPRLGEGGGVPIGCRSVAVLLHYWFLVSFMWMLMEGVVLYVALVRVFTKHNTRYAAAFTIASYGLPLLYVGGLTVPLGFVRTKNYREDQDPDYGYKQACYLDHHTSFVWSLLVPVILIFLANIGFFIMAIIIMYRHQKRQNTDDKKHKVKQWIKASISLTVVMGITWIIGFLVIEVEELFALAYIFTIFVAFQGVFIFIIFVLLSKQVKENYAKWWKAKVAESDFLSKHFGSKIFTSGTGVSAQNNHLPPPSPVACSKTSRQSSNPGTPRKAEQKLTVESCYDPKSESCS